MKVKVTFLENTLNRINEIITVNQIVKNEPNHRDEEEMIQSMHIDDIVKAYSRVIEHGLKNYKSKFTWNEIAYMLAAIRGTIFHDFDVRSTANNFISELIDYEVYFPDEAKEFDVNVQELIKKLIEGGEFSSYSLLALLHQSLIKREDIPDFKAYIEQHLGLKG
ncbi:MAG TPA: hypothetical protein PKK61_03245 [Defluviitaleaceae bacterium]|jgi:nucleoside-diphosphate-sugar epimerase|nr:hypothetical protein [Defluviitaleaceae bacterium]